MDTIVVGAGICGAAAAYFLRERGQNVLLLDRGRVSDATTGRGEGNVLVCDKLPGPERELTVLGRDLWSSLGERFPAARVTRKGALLFGHADGEPVCDEPELAPGVRALHEPGDLQVDPAGLARALAATVQTREGVEVAAVVPGSVLLADGSRLQAANVVVAAGPWSRALTGLPVEPRKGQLVALAAPSVVIRHKLIEAAYIDAVESASDELQIASVIEQTLDGDEILIGSSRERVGFDTTVRDEVTHAMIERAARFVPAIRGLPITRAWCAFRPWLPDNMPAIGAFGDGLWTTTGHEGAGVALGPISGLLLAQLICGEPPLIDPTPFDPRRFSSKSGETAL